MYIREIPESRFLASKSGTPGATRTPDTRFRKPLLYPLSYRGLKLGSPNFGAIIVKLEFYS